MTTRTRRRATCPCRRRDCGDYFEREDDMPSDAELVVQAAEQVYSDARTVYLMETALRPLLAEAMADALTPLATAVAAAVNELAARLDALERLVS